MSTGSTVAAKRFRAGAGLLVAGLLLAGCSAEPQAEQMPQDDIHVSATANPKPSGKPLPSPEPGSSEQTGQASTVELATQVGAVFAAQLGFDQSQRIGQEQLKELATPPTDTLKDVVVLPSQCEQPLEALNWSPAQLGTEVARTDFTNQAGNIAGSVEVAKVADRAPVEEHFKTVLTMRIDCSSVKLNRSEYTETLKFSNPQVGEVESQLAYTRRGNADTAQDTLVLVQTKGQYVAMVSFISGQSLADEQFGQVAKQIMDSVLGQL